MIAKTVRLNLLLIADAWCAATGKSESAASRTFYGNNDFFAELRAGDVKQLPSPVKLDMMLRKFRQKWPRNADWPFTRAIFMGRRPL